MAVIGSLRVDLGLNTAAFQDGLKGVQKSLGKVGKRMQNVGRQMSVGLTAPIVAFGALTLRSAGDFEQGMNRVQAVSGATGEQFEALRNQAKELGATTQFSASQAADGMAFLAQAGFDANEIIGAMPGTLQLAAAAQLDLGSAADIVSNVLQGYGLEVSELGRANDVLVSTFTKTNTSLEQLGESMKFAAPVASSAGVQFEETAAALGLMGNAGIQASMAGTSLRGAISRIVNPTGAAKKAMEEAGLSFTDAKGRLLPLVEIIRQLEPVAEDTGLFMQLFGQRAGPAMAALVSQGADSLKTLTTELENSGGTAERIAETQMEGFNGAMRELRSAFEGLQLAIADSGLLEWASDAVKALTRFVQNLNETNPAILKWGTVIAGLAAAIGPVLVVLGTLAIAIGAIATPIGLAVAAFVAIATAVAVFWEDLKELDATLGALVGGAWQSYLDAVASLEGAITDFLGGAWAGLVDAFTSAGEMVASVGRAFVNLNAVALGAISEMVEGVVGWLGDKLAPAFDNLLAPIRAVEGAFRWLKDQVVGNSHVPEMVDGIAREFARLDGVMVPQAQAAVAGVDRAFSDLGQTAQDSVASIGGTFKSTMQTAFSDVTTALRNGETSWKTYADIALDALDSIVNKLLDDLMDALNQVSSAAGGGGGGFFGSLLSGIGSLFGGGSAPATSPLPPIKPFADGGIVRRPTIGLIGEAGPEAVIPLREMADRTGGRGSNVSIHSENHFHGIQGTEDMQRALDERDKRLLQALQKHRRLDGSFMGVG